MRVSYFVGKKIVDFVDFVEDGLGIAFFNQRFQNNFVVGLEISLISLLPCNENNEMDLLHLKIVAGKMA